MKRREFIALLAAAGLPAFAVRARSSKVARLGYVSWQPSSSSDQLEYFRESLSRLGYIQGRDIDLEPYFTDGDRERTQNVIRDLVQKSVDILIVRVTPTAQIAKEATRTIPIVMVVADPTATGLVESLSHPGGNLTGISIAAAELTGKRFELLREIKPDLRTIAFLGLAGEPQTATFVSEATAAAKLIGLNVVVRLVQTPSTIDEKLFADLKRDGAEAVSVQPNFTGYQDKIVHLSMKSSLPVIADFPAFAQAGALLTFGVDELDVMRRLAYFVDRILKGAKPIDLPVEQPTSFRLVINTRSAKALGWSVPPVLLARADEVIE